MTRQEAANLHDWLRNSYPRNYRDEDDRQYATAVDNLADVFKYNTFPDVMAEYKRVYAQQKNEPHPSEIRRAVKAERKTAKKEREPDEAYEALRKNPRYAEYERAYGVRACRRAAKLCVETATLDELKFRLDHDISCTEKDYTAEIEAWKRGRQA